jgi:hypothetical protein
VRRNQPSTAAGQGGGVTGLGGQLGQAAFFACARTERERESEERHDVKERKRGSTAHTLGLIFGGIVIFGGEVDAEN